MKSICNFIPVKNSGELKTVHFVYETEFNKLKQPFIYPLYYMHLITKGEGVLKLPSGEYKLCVGAIFFAFPGIPFEIEGSDDLKYMYISYMGLRAQELAVDLEINLERPVLYGFEEEIVFWKKTIQRINKTNANILTESVLLYTLSYLDNNEEIIYSKSTNVLENIINYIDNNYSDTNLSLKKVADIFAYTDKYLSHLFKERMQMNFNQYLTRLRIQRSVELMTAGERNISDIAYACGYEDSVYFAKVFKKIMGCTPREYLAK